jgi:16S rRNA (guanine527-N7)-methyltransferase
MGLLGPHLDLMIRFARLLAGPGAERGLIGPRETERLWDRHLLNCAVVSELIDAGAHVDDVGSGAGLPGMVLALVRPDLEVTLVEPLLRRSTFLLEAVDELGVSNVRVVRVRAEDRAREVVAGVLPPADVATARAVAPLGQLAAWCLPLLRPGGSLLALKGAAASSEVDAAESELRAAGAARVELLSVGHGVVDPPTTVVRVVRNSRQVARTRPR